MKNDLFVLGQVNVNRLLHTSLTLSASFASCAFFRLANFRLSISTEAPKLTTTSYSNLTFESLTIMPRRSQQRFAFGAQEGTYDLLDADSDSPPSTDCYDSGDSDSLDFGAVTLEEKNAESAEQEKTAYEEDGEDEWDEDEYPPLDLNDEALAHIASCYLPGHHGKCLDITALQWGSFHEIRLLHFEDGWSCIGRFTRNRDEPLSVLESEVATCEFVRKHSSIPVPATYFVNTNPNHAVGAAFVLMERIEGQHLYRFWEDLSLEHKKDVLRQITDVILQLAELKFNQIGSLRHGGVVGRLNDVPGVDRAYNNIIEYLIGDAPDPKACTEEVNSLNDDFKTYLSAPLATHKPTAALSPPFRLLHTDFDGQNMLFTRTDPSDPPRLAGIIDWDNAHTGLLYELLEYPIFIQDVDWSPELYADNKVLRKHFVRCLTDGYPKGSKQRQQVKECFRIKEWTLSNFRDMWVRPEDGSFGVERAREQLVRLRGGRAFPYDGTLEWEPDSEVESEDEGA